MMDASAAQMKGYRGLPMEGFVARRYAKIRATASQAEERRKLAAQLTAGLPEGARILEVAPGPGYFAVELARLRRYQVSGLDISHTFVEMARENAAAAGVDAEFFHGDAASMLFADATFDLVVCQAAFKNFRRPRRALLEIHRVLRDGGVAVVQDMRKDASNRAIRAEVAAMQLGRIGSLMTRSILRGLRRRSYSVEQFRQLAEESAFHGGKIGTSGIGIDIRLTKRGSAT